MREILFLAHRIPYPPNRGDKIRSWNVLKHLGSLGRVHLGCFADNEEDADHLQALRREMGAALGQAHVEIRRKGKFAAAVEALHSGKPILGTMFDSEGMHGFVRRTLARTQVGAVYAFSVQMAQFVPIGCRQTFVMDFVDVDSAKFAEYAGSGVLRWVYRREAGKLAEFERATAARADYSLFVSEAEAQLFRAGFSSANIRSISNGIDLDHYDPAAAFPPQAAAQRPLIVFTGQMDYRPNVEAVVRFADQTLPLILRDAPSACFAIVGRNPTPAVVRLAERQGVIVTGSVPDVRTWLVAADVVVAPLRIARGIQNKVLEAMAMARPVVASAAAFQGIEAQAGKDLIVAETPAEEARAVLSLIADRPAAEALGASARRCVETGYRWDVRLEPLAELLSARERRAAA
ncbi:MAG: TIGR03087 family PEP-CTERM/XrtA system glycosyltransferase [Pseudomonadota bacterium]|nr:TIGR03087 family PEP-CTERM/XrtA system glycosyltransferase [Pseudomonadota bacterium]